MTELKRCPFCGGEAEVFDYWNEGKKKSRWVVMCKNCKGGLGELDTKEEAIEKWNNRWMIPCEEGETEGNWHTGTPTEEGWYLIKYRGIYGRAIGRTEYRAVHRYKLDGLLMIDGGIGADDIWEPFEWQKIEEN